MQFQVINFFTTSGYAPCAESQTPEEISAGRRREDRAVLRRINPRIRVSDESFIDAPLRTGVPVSCVCDSTSSALLSDDLISKIAHILRGCRADLVLAPLTLGDHMDHVAVHRAACRAFSARVLGFYEDLPYAIWTPDHLVRQKVQWASAAMGMALRDATVCSVGMARRKYRVIQGYRSQITATEARAMSDWSKKFRNGERIWLPLRSTAWRSFINSPEHFRERPHAICPGIQSLEA